MHERDPVNELYDRGCDLVEAATAIRRAVADPAGSRAIPAVLGCVEFALDELAEAAAARGLTDLELALRDGRERSAAARDRTARDGVGTAWSRARP